MTRTLTLRGVPDATLERLRARAAANRRSLNGELLEILDLAVAADVADRSQDAAPASPAAPRVRESAPTYAEAQYRAGAPKASDDAPHADPDLLSQIDQAALAALCRRHHVRWLAVFGSHVRGDARPDSDVDVVVDFAPGKTPGFGIVGVADALRPVFGGRRVDLVTRRGLAPRLHNRVLAVARTLYEADARDDAQQHVASEAARAVEGSGAAGAPDAR